MTPRPNRERTIKFRAWDTSDRIWLDTATNRLTLDGSSLLDANGWAWNVPGRVIIEQFTGLLDKNGREIYEGDIVRVWIYQDEDAPEFNESKVHTVVWCGDDYPAFDLEPAYAEESNSLSHIMAGADGETIEVIGNRWENPELIK